MIPNLCGLFLLSTLLSPMTPLKAGNRILRDLRGKRFLSARGSRKLKGQLFYLPFYSPFQFCLGGLRKPIICMYVYICGYIYISCYSNSTSQWLSELLSHHTYLPILTNLNAAVINSSRRKIGSMFFLNRWESNDYT